MKCKILIFETTNSLNYWFKYISEFLGKSNYSIYIKTREKIISFGLTELRFITYPYIENKLIGLHDKEKYTNLETKLERNFKEILYEIVKE